MIARWLALLVLVMPFAAMAQTEPAPVKTILDGNLTVNGLIQTGLAIVGFVGLWLAVKRSVADNRAYQQEREDRLMAEITKHNDTMERRIALLETSATETRVKLEAFVPKGEIDARFEHERNNRITGETATRNALQRHDEAIGAIRVDVGQLGAKLDAATSGIAGLDQRFTDLSREMASGFEKLRDTISRAGRPA